jgi:hypothetical protein
MTTCNLAVRLDSTLVDTAADSLGNYQAVATAARTHNNRFFALKTVISHFDSIKKAVELCVNNGEQPFPFIFSTDYSSDAGPEGQINRLLDVKTWDQISLAHERHPYHAVWAEFVEEWASLNDLTVRLERRAPGITDQVFYFLQVDSAVEQVSEFPA